LEGIAMEDVSLLFEHWVYFTADWYILWTFGIFCGIFHQKKLATLVRVEIEAVLRFREQDKFDISYLISSDMISSLSASVSLSLPRFAVEYSSVARNVTNKNVPQITQCCKTLADNIY
jgi:hypothetical protein